MSTKIYTKTGDEGKTGLFGGARVAKFDIRIEAYGTVDELNSWVGLIRDEMAHAETVQFLMDIQHDLFAMGSHLAADPAKENLWLPEFPEQNVLKLEHAIDGMDAVLPAMKNFVLPGGHILVSHIHIARCVCRRAERAMVQLAQEAEVKPVLLQYMNRLSDYLFTLSRWTAQELKVTEQPWVPRKADV